VGRLRLSFVGFISDSKELPPSRRSAAFLFNPAGELAVVEGWRVHLAAAQERAAAAQGEVVLELAAEQDGSASTPLIALAMMTSPAPAPVRLSRAGASTA